MHPRVVHVPKRWVGIFCGVLWTALVAGVAGQSSGVPSPPQHVTSTVDGNTVTLVWQATAVGVTGFIVDAALAPGGPSVARLAVPTSTLTVSAPNGVYYVRVRAVNAVGEGPPSQETTVIVASSSACGQPPSAPRALAAAVNGSMVAFTWQAPLSGGVERYELRAGTQPGTRGVAALNVGASLQFTVAAPPGTFYVVVVAHNGCGASPESTEVVVAVGSSGPSTCPRGNVCLVDGALVLSYPSYADRFPNGLPTAPGNWRWEALLNDLDAVVDVGGYDFVLLFTKTALPGTGFRVNSGASVRSPSARNNGMDWRFINRRYSVRDFGARLKGMPFLDTIGRPPSLSVMFHEIGHAWPVAPAYRVINRSTWNPATDPVAWLATSCDAQGHWCGPWYGGPTGGPLPNIPGLMAFNGNGPRFNPFDLHVMGLMGHAEVAQLTYFVEAPVGPLRPTPVRYPITQASIIESRRMRADAVYYVEGDGRRIPDTDPEMAHIRVLVVVAKQDNETLGDGERALLASIVQQLPVEWAIATYGRSQMTLPLLWR
jgi:hypothetical protein